MYMTRFRHGALAHFRSLCHFDSGEKSLRNLNSCQSGSTREPLLYTHPERSSTTYCSLIACVLKSKIEGVGTAFA